jgi:hypothetical protein
MHTNRITTAFVVILAAAAVAGPTAAIADQSSHTASATPGHTAPGPPTWPVDPQPIVGPSAPGPPTWPVDPQPIVGPSAPGPPTWPVDPQPIVDPYAPVSNTSASGFDSGSAAIGGGAVAALILALGGAARLRRRHLARPRSLASH